ncbi:MAG: cation efflux family transporter, partial [Gammaproteobacteria bacterium HGW-Gammaproteobacteria-5]
MTAKANTTRTIFFALGANFAIFLAKGVAAVLSGSGAMLAEAVHSLADVGNQG